jgi:ParB family chromosome partitioning protein
VAKKERGLGRGLDALLSRDLHGLDSEQIMYIETERITPRTGQPRTVFSEETLQELAKSIKTHGLLQPLLLRPKGEDFEIIAGERRWRAAQIVGLDRLPAMVKEIGDSEAAEISLIENIQRDDLSAVEEARAYRHLIEKYGYTQERVAETIGKSRAHVANTMRILSLPAEVLQMIESGQLTAGHARTLLALPDATAQLRQAAEIVNKKMSVREAEARGRSRKKPAKHSVEEIPIKTPDILDLEERLQQHFSTRVDVYPGSRGGKIQISYYDGDDLDRILELLQLE